MKIEVLGSGCPMSMEQNVKKALTELDGTVVLQGKSPTVAQIKELIRAR